MASLDDQRQGFDEFYRGHYAPTVRLAHLLTGSDAVAEDAAQDAFVRLRRHYDRVDNPGAYLRTVTVSVAKNWYRRVQREQARLIRHGVPDIVLEPSMALLDDAVRALPYRQRAVLVLRYWLDLSETAIAAALGCRVGTVKSLHSRALAQLRKDVPR